MSASTLTHKPIYFTTSVRSSWIGRFMCCVLAGLFLLSLPDVASAQYFRFGKNKVQYEDKEWSFLQSKHFDIYYYEGAQYLADFTANAAEEAYLQAERLFDHRITNRIPIIVYQSHNDFAVTNAVNLPTFSEGIAAVTEPYKNRIAIPFVGDYRQFRQTLHHELIHAVINDIYYGGTLQSILQNNIALRIPHWFNEGLAEFASEGWSSNADDWLRDAIIHDDVADIPYINGFASYQAGQGVWDYIAEQYGQEKIGEILQRLRLTHSIDGSFKRATGLTLIELSERWKKTLKQIYYPELGARESITDFARKIVSEKNGGFYNTSPALSPLGDRMAFVSSVNGLFDVLIIDTNDGKVSKKLIDGQTSAEYESLRILSPGLSWSPDGTQLALAVKSGPTDAIAVVDVDTEESTHYRIPDVDQIISVSWSPDGTHIAFEAAMDAQSDLFVLDLETHETINYTNDVFSDHEPGWSPDGKFLVFHSDRGSYTELGVYQASDFAMVEHDYGQYDVYLLPLGNSNTARRLTYNTTWDDQSAKFGSDPDRVLFISDRNGVFNLYEKELSSGLVRPLTNSLNGISQVTLSADGDEAALVSMEQGRTLIYLMKSPFERQIDAEELPPNVWAQRVMQETILPAPAITLAPRSLQRDNPFLRDATDGIAYVRQPNAGGALMADRLMLLANRSPLSVSSAVSQIAGEEEEEEPLTTRSTWDSTRYGSVNVNFDDYIFAERSPDETEDLAFFLRDPFEPEDNIGEDGRFKPKRYKLRFSPDLVYGSAGYDALFGVQGITQITFSDMLGDHQVLVASNLLIDLRNSDYMMSYAYLPSRLDWSTSAFHVSRLLPDNNRNTIYRYRQYGLRFNI
ncbi:MAG: peptidase S9, partial [Rhodothermales bacterium]